MRQVTPVDGFRLGYDRVGEFFADARLIRLPGAGHFTPLERPGEFAAAIISAC